MPFARMLASSQIRSSRLISAGSVNFVMVASVETPTTSSASRSHRRQTTGKGCSPISELPGGDPC